MNNIGKIVIVAILVGGCATNGYVKSNDDPELTCQDRVVTVNHAPAFLAAYPEYLVACAGQNIVVNVVPSVPQGSATITPADRSPGPSDWLGRGESLKAGQIVIKIPEGTVPGEYKYNITIDGVGTLDPRVRISR